MPGDKPRTCQYASSRQGTPCGRKLYITEKDSVHCIYHSEDIDAKSDDQKIALEDLLKKHELWLETGFGEKANIPGANLQKADLRNAKLKGAIFEGARLQRADLQGADLEGANLQGASLQEAILLEANLKGANLHKAVLLEADLQEANLQKANLQEANLQKAVLEWAELQRANLKGANLQEADLLKANLQGAILRKAKLLGADLQEAVLEGADLQDADLQDAKLLVANLSLVNLKGASLQEANLIGVTLLGAELENVNLESIIAGPDIFVQIPPDLREKYKKTWKIYGRDPNRVISRSIELSAEHLQAGISILNYFGTVIRQKHPQKKIKIRLEQDGLKVAMTVEAEPEDKETVGSALHDYGMVLRGEKSIDQFLLDPGQATALQRRLEQIQTELRLAPQMQPGPKKRTAGSMKSLENSIKAFLDRLGKLLAQPAESTDSKKGATDHYLFNNPKYRDFVQSLIEQQQRINGDLYDLSQKLAIQNPDDQDIENVKEILQRIIRMNQINARKLLLILNDLF